MNNIVNFCIRVFGFFVPVEEFGIVVRRSILEDFKCYKHFGHFPSIDELCPWIKYPIGDIKFGFT